MTTEEKIARLIGSNPNRLIITFNDHWVVYETIEKYDGYRWISDVEKERGIATNSAWEINVSGVEGPVLARVTASTLAAALDAAVIACPGGEPSEWAGEMANIEAWIAYVLRDTRHTLEFEFNADGDDAKKPWGVIYYPNTPVGHCHAEAPRLDQAFYWLTTPPNYFNPLSMEWLSGPVRGTSACPC